MFLQILLLICSVCNPYGVASTASPGCGVVEYSVGQLCCLACPRGYRVNRDCTATTVTLCSKCPHGTFKEGFGGQKQCSACTKCDPDLGRTEKRFCTSTSDAECGALDGFFCSNATLSCQRHTTCDSGVQIKPGTDSTDSTCITYVVIVFITIGCICFILLLVLGAWGYRRHQRKMVQLELDRELTDLDDLIHEAETLEQAECGVEILRLQWKKKTPEQERRFKELNDQYQKKRRILKLDRELTELENRIREAETPEQADECRGLIYRLQWEKKTPEQERRFKELDDQYREKWPTLDLVRELTELEDQYLEKWRILELDRKLTDLENQIREMETPEQVFECGDAIIRLQREKKTPEQKRKLKELIDQYQKKSSILELDWKLTELDDLIREMETQEQADECKELADKIREEKKKTLNQEKKLTELIDQFLEKKKTLNQEKKLAGEAAGEGTSGLSSSPPLPPEPTADLQTSSPPAPSRETRPAAETTPLMSSESPAPTGDQQEHTHTSRTTTADVTMDGDDEDQSPGAYRSGTGQHDIEMGPVQTWLKDETTPLMSSESPAPTGDPQEHTHTSRTTTADVTIDCDDEDQSPGAYRSGAGQHDIEMGPVQTRLKDDNGIL